MLRVALEGDLLILVQSSQEGVAEQVLFCGKASRLLLGSAADCDLKLPHAHHHHALLELGAHGLTLTDLGSEGGTFVNGRRVVRARLKEGDTLRLGTVEFEPLPAETTRTFRVNPIETPSAELPITSGARGLLELSVALGRPSTLADKLDQILDYSLRLGQFDRAAAWVIDPENPSEILYQRHREAPGHPAAVISKTILRQVMDGDAVIVSDAGADLRVRDAMSVKLQNIRTCVALPLRTTQRIWGMLYLDCLHPQPVAESEDQEFLAGFASLAAVAIENGWLATKSQKEALLKERLSRFFPPTTVDSILEQPDGRLKGAVMPVTILFCDIRNYTGISFAQPPEKVAAWLDDYFSRIVPLVFANEGTLEKYIGDAMLAIWGAPTALSPADQALLSCRAASQIHKAVAEFETAWPDLACQVGIGIHHGPAFVGTIGHESYLQYAALGSTTNLAARLCSAAGPGETILSRYLADLLPASEFSHAPRPAVYAKGFPELVEVSVLSPP